MGLVNIDIGTLSRQEPNADREVEQERNDSVPFPCGGDQATQPTTPS